MAFQAETPAPGPQAAVVAAFTGGAATLSGGGVRDTFVQAVDATLPLTEVGLGRPPRSSASRATPPGRSAGSCRGRTPTSNSTPCGSWRRVRGRTGPGCRGGTVALPSGRTIPTRPWRSSARTSGRSASSASPSAGRGGQRLRPARAAPRCGRSRPTPAVASVVREPAGATGVWVKRLAQAEVPEPLRYQGRLHRRGRQPDLRVLIDHWIAEPNRWRCPVVVDARTTTDEGSPAATPDTAFVSGKDNVWGPDEAQGTGVFLFVTDFSALPPIVIPAPPPPVISRRLGFYRNGPVVRNEGPFTPATIAINLDTLTAGLWDTDEAKSTSRVIAAVALRLPCQGFLDGIDAVTVARVVGLGTLYLKDDTSGAAVLGGLGVYLSVARFVEPAAYGLAFGATRHPVVAALGQRPGRRLRSQRREGSARSSTTTRPGGSSLGSTTSTARKTRPRPWSPTTPTSGAAGTRCTGSPRRPASPCGPRTTT